MPIILGRQIDDRYLSISKKIKKKDTVSIKHRRDEEV